jgi:hypothetical protein
MPRRQSERTSCASAAEARQPLLQAPVAAYRAKLLRGCARNKKENASPGSIRCSPGESQTQIGQPFRVTPE